MPRFLVLTVRKPTFDRAILPTHLAFIDDLRVQGKIELAGGFTNQTGGAYILTADNAEEAGGIAYLDPLHTSDSSSVSVHEWNAR